MAVFAIVLASIGGSSGGPLEDRLPDRVAFDEDADVE